MPPASVLAYAQLVAAEVAATTGGLLQAVYVHGSAALGGWQADRSDVDMLLIADDAVSAATLDQMAGSLVATSAACPGRGLESSAVGSAQARAPAAPWPYLLHVATGPGEPGGRIHRGADSAGDADLLIHYAVARAAGWAAYGPPAADLIGEVSRPAILEYLAGELDWGLQHAPEAYAVLNACRSLMYLEEGRIVSKIAGGKAALRLGQGPEQIIRSALAQQEGREPEQPSREEAIDFVLSAGAALRTAT
jgi:hypothetical protein